MTTRIAAEICLYGTREIGAGWLARLQDPDTAAPTQLLGTGEPVKYRCFTEAVWLAVAALETAGVRSGVIRIFAAGGEMMADVQAGQSVPYYGDLAWRPALPALVMVIPGAD